MNLILWRHAEAEDVATTLRMHRSTDLQRELTQRGHKQADKMAAWLRPACPKTRWCWPAPRSARSRPPAR